MQLSSIRKGSAGISSGDNNNNIKRKTASAAVGTFVCETIIYVVKMRFQIYVRAYNIIKDDFIGTLTNRHCAGLALYYTVHNENTHVKSIEMCIIVVCVCV